MVYCERCGGAYPEGKKFCRKCGKPLIEMAAPATTTSGSLRCPSCGRESTPGKKFCRFCGTSLSGSSGAAPTVMDAVTGSVLCPNCGHEATPSKKFCSRCGLRLRPEMDATPVRTSMVSGPARVSGATSIPLDIASPPARLRAPTVTAAATGSAAAVCLPAEPEIDERGQVLPENEQTLRVEAPAVQRPRELTREGTKARLPFVIGGLVVLFAVAGVLFWYFFASPVARIHRAIGAGKLVSPEGSSAYDFYRRFKPGLSAGALNAVREKVLPKLNAAGEAFLQKRAEGSSFKESEVRQLVSIYDWAADLAPQDSRILSRRNYVQGMAASIKGNPSAALQFLKDSVKYDSSWAPAYNELGKAYVRLNDHYHAAESYRKAIDLDPKWVFPQVNLAGVYLHNRQWDLAEQGYQQAIQTDNTYATAWYFLGQTYEAEKRPADAITSYEKALELAGARPSSAFKPDVVQRHVQKLKAKLSPR